VAWRCRVCEHTGAPAEQARLRGSTRDVASEHFTAWRCAHCASINQLEAVDLARIYAHYPLIRQKDDFFARRLLARRLALLRRAGLRPGMRVLDHGCGSGAFVQALRRAGFAAQGYEPHNPQWSHTEVLGQAFDVVTSQDVLEHVDEPRAFLDELAQGVKPGGLLVLGTPFADSVRLTDPLDAVGVLHPPFHRFLVSRAWVERLCARPGLRVEQVLQESYVNTAWPFANPAFLFRLFASGDGTMDFAFDPLSPGHFLRHPHLFFWGLFGRWLGRRQDLLVVLRRTES
jgi:SAM-dependent methyltransferase